MQYQATTPDERDWAILPRDGMADAAPIAEHLTFEQADEIVRGVNLLEDLRAIPTPTPSSVDDEWRAEVATQVRLTLGIRPRRSGV